jgi:hypothetical protein
MTSPVSRQPGRDTQKFPDRHDIISTAAGVDLGHEHPLDPPPAEQGRFDPLRIIRTHWGIDAADLVRAGRRP